ncbi:helix-turn-helix domain-containing protein [Sellimonas catena]|uniref:XRE family transcriptional regulator n=1 Tax=Sellimonas catena TaxID=2994035 RepID=A0A9W6C7Q5_9FIRM|nr:helix-turn-helix domain-containing protein [Sellimonas catena]GLG88893.1 XRE family transcriptional regulator [Sellimonas catena]
MSYITGNTIRTLREKKGITQKELAEIISVSDKTVSKWETNKGLPDIGIIEELAKALKVSLAELFTGDLKINENVSGNMKKIQFYVCPICGNVITAVGEGHFSCCGITLPKQEPESIDEEHSVFVETVDDEYSITMQHSMSKEHYVSFIAYITSGSVEMIKLYPEQDVSVRFRKKGHGILYVYCNRHGLFRKNI